MPALGDQLGLLVVFQDEIVSQSLGDRGHQGSWSRSIVVSPGTMVTARLWACCLW